MNDFFLERTKYTPEIDFRFSAHTLSLTGESFPENAALFYSAIFAQVREYLSGLTVGQVTANARLTYFNSSSTRQIFSLFSQLNDAAGKGNVVTVNWDFDEDDDRLREFGEEIAQEFTDLRVKLNAHAGK